jgi:hypothetical protein
LENPTEDLFGNVLISRFSSVVPDASQSEDEWTLVDDSHQVSYSSLLGIPVAGTPITGNSSFKILSRYFVVDCQNLTYMEIKGPNGEINPLFNNSDGNTFVIQGPNLFSISVRSGYIIPFNLNATVYGWLNTAVAECTLSTSDVESSISCRDQSCRVDAMRNSTQPISDRYNITGTDITNIFGDLPLATVGAMSHGGDGASSMIERWINGPNASFDPNSGTNLSLTPLDTLSSNLGVVFNTFWQATYWSDFLTSNLTANVSFVENYLDQTWNLPVYFNKSMAHTTQFNSEQYIRNFGFAFLLIAVSVLVLLEALASLVLMSITLAPDIFGYVSSPMVSHHILAVWVEQRQ